MPVPSRMGRAGPHTNRARLAVVLPGALQSPSAFPGTGGQRSQQYSMPQS